MCRTVGELTSERVYVSLLGRSAWALVNTYYAVVRETEFRPDTVSIAVEAPFSGRAGAVSEAVRAISEHNGFSPEIECIPVDQGDVVDVFSKVYALMVSKKREGAKVALDITPGRKAVVAGTLLPIKLDDVDHVFYLEISTTRDVAKPYQMIPRQYHTLHDFKAEAVRARDGD